MHLRTTSACYAHRAASSRQQLANKKDKLSSGARIKAKTEEGGGGSEFTIIQLPHEAECVTVTKFICCLALVQNAICFLKEVVSGKSRL